jgi:hypothetical protein
VAIGSVLIIQPSISLSEAADRIGKALAIRLVPETSGRFEEYPAFVGSTSDQEFVLLGPPAPEDDIRDDPTQDYALQITPLQPSVQPDRYLALHRLLEAAGIAVTGHELPPNNSFKPNR